MREYTKTNYAAMTKQQLKHELECNGDFYYANLNLPKKDMVEILERAEEARHMSLEELVAASEKWQAEHGVR